jgi:hypothetical protein
MIMRETASGRSLSFFAGARVADEAVDLTSRLRRSHRDIAQIAE